MKERVQLLVELQGFDEKHSKLKKYVKLLEKAKKLAEELAQVEFKVDVIPCDEHQ